MFMLVLNVSQSCYILNTVLVGRWGPTSEPAPVLIQNYDKNIHDLICEIGRFLYV